MEKPPVGCPSPTESKARPKTDWYDNRNQAESVLGTVKKGGEVLRDEAEIIQP